jgi:hypothetical protein
MKIPTSEENQEESKCREYRDRECLKVVKKYAQQELDEINKRRFLSPYNQTRIKFLKFILKSKRFAGLPIADLPEAIEEIQNLPFMEARFIPSIEDGAEIERQRVKRLDKTRTTKSTDTKRSQRAVKEKYVIEAYTHMVNDKTEKAILKTLSETKMAQRVKERVEADLKNVRTSKQRLVLKLKVGRNESVISTGLSHQTIIDILRKRDKTKLPFYPWEKRTPPERNVL